MSNADLYSNANPFALLSLIPNQTPVFDSKACRNLLDPKVRLVGYKFGGDQPVDTEFIASSGYYNGYQNGPHNLDAREFDKFNERTFAIRPGDVLVMNSWNKVRAIGIVLYYIDIKSYVTGQILRLFRVAWANTDTNVELDMGGPFDKGNTISTSYTLSELSRKTDFYSGGTKSVAVHETYEKLYVEINKARARFLRSNLNLSPKAF